MSAAQSRVIETYRAMHPRSAALYERARSVIPGGVTHDGRHMKPFPVYVERARGSHKWDVDGHEYVDYWMGHGALFLGHCHPAVVKAIQEQAARGTHYGACHELEVRWAELITRLVPSAEMVRFAMSGTEATHLAIRIARAYTGRNQDREVPRATSTAGTTAWSPAREPALRRAHVGRRAGLGPRTSCSLSPAQRHQGGGR